MATTGAVWATLFLAACQGEDRPRVEIIASTGTPTGSVSGSGSGTGSVSGVLPAVSTPTRTAGGTPVATTAPGSATAGSEHYKPVSDVQSYLDLALDVRDIVTLMAPAAEGKPVSWVVVSGIYTGGANARTGTGALRNLKGLATSAPVLAEFPNGPAVYGSPAFLDDTVQAGLSGTGRGQGLSENARRQLVEKGISAILYGKTLQEMTAARAKVQQSQLADKDGAPHNVDEAWGLYAGTVDGQGNRPWSLVSIAVKREANFKLDGKLDAPIQKAMEAAKAAAQKGGSSGGG